MTRHPFTSPGFSPEWLVRERWLTLITLTLSTLATLHDALDLALILWGARP